MELLPIKTVQDYEQALQYLETLILAPENSKEAMILEVLSILIEDYESKHYKIDKPDPIEAIKFQMNQLGLKRKDMEKVLGSRGRVSEILNRKRPLTLAMIRKLNKQLHISADILINQIHQQIA